MALALRRDLRVQVWRVARQRFDRRGACELRFHTPQLQRRDRELTLDGDAVDSVL